MKIAQLFKTTLYQLKSQRLLTVVSICGTALAIFLIMIVVMLQQVKTAPFPPESNRDRMLYYSYISAVSNNDDNQEFNCPMAWNFVKDMFPSLETPETFSCISVNHKNSILSVIGDKEVTASVKETDHRFWNIFDFTFISGKPFTADDFNTAAHTAVLNESTALSLFGNSNCIGKEVLINGTIYKITGVVKDVTQLAPNAYSDVWANIATKSLKDDWSSLTGWLSVVILAKSPHDIPIIKEEISRRTKQINNRDKNGWQIIERGRPYTQLEESVCYGSSQEPDVSTYKRQMFMIFLILLIVPAINLLSMTQSRLRQRTAEIAIRRAFGCKKESIIINIVSENMLLTLMGGVIGLILSVCFAYCFDWYLFEESSPVNGMSKLQTSASLSSLLQWSTFGWSLFFCFIINILSSGIPAWKASHNSIAKALSGHHK
ncbi:ABC transporter permease [uncultured Muribaculum sp.]|uniref:ABC transporter permease n=1 Tax=uncultured Muribaculum sp. TaxID=1918613 RepID=UPI00263959C9|nr:ABC transporter permease [uncultured Muribaculum sp.]